MTYDWREGYSFRGVTPQLIGEEIDKIKRESGTGEDIVAKALVATARRPNSPLHDCSAWKDWDDAVAAQGFYEDQARRLIRSVVEVTYTDDGKRQERIAFIHVRPPESGPCYRTSAHVMSHEEELKQAIADVLAAIAGLRKRCDQYEEMRATGEMLGQAAKVAAEAAAQAKRVPKRRSRKATVAMH